MIYVANKKSTGQQKRRSFVALLFAVGDLNVECPVFTNSLVDKGLFKYDYGHP